MKRSHKGGTIAFVSIAILVAATLAPTVAYAKANPFAQHIAFLRGGNVWRANSSGRQLKRLTSKGVDFDPTWSGDHRRIYFLRGQSGGTPTICWVSAGGGDTHVLKYSGQTAGAAHHIAASSNGNWLYVSGSSPDSAGRLSRVVRVNLKTKRSSEVLRIRSSDPYSDSGIESLDVSRSGKRLAYVYFEGDSWKVHIRTLSTGGEVAQFRAAWEVRFSRSGRSLAYTSDPRYGNAHKLGYMSLGLRVGKTLLKEGKIENKWGDSLAAFSPDGKRIVFVRRVSGPQDAATRSNLIAIGATGGKARLLLKNADDADW